MQFTRDALAGIIDGSITLTFRAWKRAQAVTGSRHRIWGHLIHVDDARTVDVADITEDDAARAGAASRAAVLERLGVDAGEVWRVEFHYVGADDRIALRSTELDDERRADIQRRLDRMDRASATGPWTARTLRLIATYPGTVSTALARHAGQERPAFKINVRKLKELGLTESLDIGYRLSPLGEAFVQGT